MQDVPEEPLARNGLQIDSERPGLEEPAVLCSPYVVEDAASAM